MEKIEIPTTIIADIIPKNGNFPNNPHLPLLIYKNALEITTETTKDIQNALKDNHWINSWVDGIYTYHHYHSNTHEALVVYAGECDVQIGGEGGKIYHINKGDVIIFPVGVSHKNIACTKDFKTIGAYPIDVDYDIKYGRPEEHPKVEDNIKMTPLPTSDPIFGKKGLLFKYWNLANT